MQFAIPHAPRKVSLRQVPGAIGRLIAFLVLAIAITAAVGFGAKQLSAAVSKDAAVLDRAIPVAGTFVEAKLPPKDKREDAFGTMTVLYEFEHQKLSANGVEARADVAEGYGPGAQVALLVDPQLPDHPFEAQVLRDRVARGNLLPWGLLVGALLGAGAFLFELRRLVSRELDPLRKGMIVWLTPEAPLPDTKQEVRVKGRFLKGEVTHQIVARGRPGRAPVRNGEKILTAVSPRWTHWGRIVDEDLAKTLGWIRD